LRGDAGDRGVSAYTGVRNSHPDQLFRRSGSGSFSI
jgi:hypothetical protein